MGGRGGRRRVVDDGVFESVGNDDLRSSGHLILALWIVGGTCTVPEFAFQVSRFIFAASGANQRSLGAVSSTRDSTRWFPGSRFGRRATGGHDSGERQGGAWKTVTTTTTTT